MRELTNNQIKNYLSIGDIAYSDSTEFRWLKEYKRCKYRNFMNNLNFIVISKSIKSDIDTTTASSKTFNVNENYEIEKENEWWIRQKYKLMKALMRKWRQSEESKIEQNEKPKQKRPKPIQKNSDMISNISLEKIPIVAKDVLHANEVKIVKQETMYTNDEGGKMRFK